MELFAWKKGCYVTLYFCNRNYYKTYKDTKVIHMLKKIWCCFTERDFERRYVVKKLKVGIVVKLYICHCL